MASPRARLFQEGLAAAHAGETERALEVARTMIARNPRDVHAYQIIGFAHFTRGRNREAFEAFSEANRLAPNQPAIINWLGVLLKERADFENARTAFAQAARLAPESAEIICNLGETLSALGERDAAKDAYERAAAIMPPNAPVLAKTARFFESAHDIEQARHYAERALELDPSDEIALIAMAEVEMREQNYEVVIARLANRIWVESSNLRNRSKMLHLFANALDRTGRRDEAFNAYAAANNIQKTLYTNLAAEERSPLTPDNVARLTAYFENEDISKWTQHDALEGPAPAFLLGFVRSGTTLLDQILSSHLETLVLEEGDTLADAWRDLFVDDDGLNKLASLSRGDVERYRKAYWRRVDKLLQRRFDKTLFVDKAPLNTVQLGLIYRIFPDAKIIFAMRDPRDCVFSAFQQHFGINAAMYQFLSLESAADYYDQVMTLGRLYRDKLPLDSYEIRYEALVEDLEGQSRALAAFLGLEWSEAMLAYYETARKRSVLTASRNQVVNKPYTSSIGKWRRYEEHMRAILPTLDRWAEEFGYSVNAL